jgi:putative ABC transport system permease protein
MLTGFAPASVANMQLLSGLGVVSFEGIRLDAAALAVMAALALATGVLFGLVPALIATRPSLLPALKEDGEPPSRARDLRGRNALVVAEVALALVLLAGSGLMLRSLGNLMGVNPGFDAEQVLTMRFSRTNAFAPESLPGTYDRIIERIAALPGVTAVALADCPPVSGGCNSTLLERRDRSPVEPSMRPEVGVHWISPEWTPVMRIPLLRGRLFDGRERPDGPKAVLVSETAARTIWPGEDAIGKPVSVGQGGFHDDTALVVGIVGDVRFVSVDEAPRPEVYLPYTQSPFGRTMLFVRTAGEPARLAPVVRRVVREIIPDFPVYDVRTMEERAAESVGYARFSTLLLLAFAALALGLATLGIYGVISFAVAQRTREIGIRMALGATGGDVVRSVVRWGARLAAAGVGIGLVGAVVATRLLRSQLYDVAPDDPATFVAIVTLLAAAALLASWLPARRAAGVQPTEALRGD